MTNHTHSIESSSAKVTNSIESIEFPTNDLQTYIRDELKTLTADVLKYDEAFNEYRKAQQSIESLHEQIEAQREKCAKLQEAVRDSQHEETNLKSRYTSLESELENWKGKACNHESDPSQIEHEMAMLRKQAKIAEDSLRAECTELGRAQQKLEDQAKELAKTKVRVSTRTY